MAFEVELEPWPIPSSLVLAGDPVASGRVLWRSDDGTRGIATYRCTPGRFAWRFEEDETVVCLEGAAAVNVDGQDELDLRPGVLAHFSSGLESVWDIQETLLDYVVLYSPEGLRG